jgi:roadblock/LC7 domain-containing protein
LFGAKLGAAVAFETPDLAMNGAFAFGIFDHAGELTAISLKGRTARMPGLPATLQAIPSDFKVELDSVKLTKDGACASATGKIWTDMLAKGSTQLGWSGPEISGPIACEAGRFLADAKGVSANGDTAEAKVDMGADLKGAIQATVTTKDQLSPSKMAQAGFQSTQPGRWDLAFKVGR